MAPPAKHCAHACSVSLTMSVDATSKKRVNRSHQRSEFGACGRLRIFFFHHSIVRGLGYSFPRRCVLTAAATELLLQQMQQIFPDVKKGDRITGVQRPGEAARFFVNGQPRGEVYQRALELRDGRKG